MTARDTKHTDKEIQSSLEEILDVVQAIDQNVVELLDTVSDHYLTDGYGPGWSYDEYLADHDY